MMTRDEILAYQAKEKEFLSTPIGKAFSKFKHTQGQAWRLDGQDWISDKKLRLAWDEANKAEAEFRRILAEELSNVTVTIL